MNIDHAHLRIARPTSDLERIRRFYVEGLGLSVLYESKAQVEHRSWELMMCGPENASWHMEFTRSEPHAIAPSPTVDDLLVFYLGDSEAVARVSRALEKHGGAVVHSDNPYWDDGGTTIVDPDGYRVVVTTRTWGAPTA